MQITFKIELTPNRTIDCYDRAHWQVFAPHLRQVLLSTLVLSKKILSALSVLQLSWTTVRAVHRRSLRHAWAMSHVVSRTSNLISQYLQAPESPSIFKLIILQHNLLHGGRSKKIATEWQLASYIIGFTVQ